MTLKYANNYSEKGGAPFQDRRKIVSHKIRMRKKVTENFMPGTELYAEFHALVAVLRDLLARFFKNFDTLLNSGRS